VFGEAVGCVIDAEQLAECRRRFPGLDRVRFLQTSELAGAASARAYDVVTCMEVLEHCVDAERVRVLDDLRRFVGAAGRVIISVPIEVGPALLGKQLFRALAAWRGHGDYRHRETYSPRELAAAVLNRPPLARAEYNVETPSGPRRYCGHKGFDWRILEREIADRLTVEQRLFTPLGALGSMLNSQVWFVCRPR
jgi:SAM-dependent methyltransferase